MEGETLYGPWFEHVTDWIHHTQEKNILFLHYEQMLAKPIEAIFQLAKFAGIELSQERAEYINSKSSFESMKNDDVVNYSWFDRHKTEAPFMRKGIAGDWVNYFTQEQDLFFMNIYQQKLQNNLICPVEFH